jgi:hypothetical protein
LGTPSIIEAQRPTLFIDSLDNALARDTLLVAFRYPNISTDQQTAISAWFSGRQGTPFNAWGAVHDAIFQFLGASVAVNVGTAGNSFYCSQLVIQGYSANGLALTNGDPIWSPNDLAALAWTDQLEYIGHLKA